MKGGTDKMLFRFQSAIRSAIHGFRFPARSAAHWDAAGGGSRLSNMTPPAAGVHTRWGNPATIRGRAEHLWRNDPTTRKAVNAIVTGTVGASGITPMFRYRDPQRAWERWTPEADATGRYDLAGLVCQVLETVIVSGEAFVTLTIDPTSKTVPLRLQVLGPQFLDTSRNDQNTSMGIQYEGVRPIGYWLYERDPGAAAPHMQSRFVPAANCLHIFRPIAPGAQRGQSWLAPVLLALKELAEYLEAALVRQKVSALYAGFVKTPDGTNPITTAGVPSLEPGSMVRLLPNEDIQFSEPPDVGATFDPFVRAQLRRIAAGMNVPYEILSGDLSAVTFASGRHGLLEFQRSVEAIQYLVLVHQLCEPVLRRWASLAVALGVIEKEPESVRWICPKIDMLDPRQETLATVERIRNGLTSRTAVVAESGWRVDDIDAEIAADNARADSLGLTLDSDPRRVTKQGQEQQSQVQTEPK